LLLSDSGFIFTPPMTEAKLFIKTPTDPVPVKFHNATLETRSRIIWKFLEKRDLISIPWLAAKVGYDRSNFWRLMRDKKKLPQKLLVKVEKELSIYGLNN
jgi:hypothetical protein